MKNTDYIINLGKIIRKKRKEMQLTQQELANIVVSPRKHIINLELGRVNPSLQILIEICQHLSISIDNIIYPINDEMKMMMNETLIKLSHCTLEQQKMILKVIQLVAEDLITNQTSKLIDKIDEMSIEYKSQIGRIIKQKRKNMQLTQQDLANITGVSRRHIANLEAGKTHASFEMIAKISKVLSISIDNIVYHDIYDQFEKDINDNIVSLTTCSSEQQKMIIKTIRHLTEVLKK